MAKIKSTRIDISQAVIDRIARRVADAEIGYAPDDDANWRYGVDAAWLAGLRDYWRDRYDWRAAEALFNEHPQYRCEIDGVPIHFFRFRPPGKDSYPLILTHGWPGSPLEFMVAGPLLAKQGFDVIVPSLPGYGFSGRPTRPIGPARTASMWRRLMVDGLGFQRFGAQGGDWGSLVTRALGHGHSDVVGAIHLNFLHITPSGEVSPEVREWQWQLGAVLGPEGAYAAMHATKPQTIGLALADSPIGFAGWVIEKCRTWSDCGGDVESVFSKDALITNVMTYLATGNVQAGIWMYNGASEEIHNKETIAVPTGLSVFPGEFIPLPPRSEAEKMINIVRWNTMPKGGHFAAWEQPQLFTAEVADFFKDFH